MIEVPEHINTGISSKANSLGDSPAFPPKPDFAEHLLSSYFEHVSKGVEGMDVNTVVSELNRLVSECQSVEAGCRAALEKLCSDIIMDMFKIPEDTIHIEVNLKDTIDTTDCRMIPEEDEEFSFDDINDMNNIGAEIKKRRMLNALIEGASETYAYNVSNYVKELFNINPELPPMYSKIIKYSEYLMYALDETKLSHDNGGGVVKVILKAQPEMLSVIAEATIFPVLLQNTIKGLLEVAILQGLPDNREKAYYIMKKADYKMAEVWDSRFGVPLWKLIEKEGDINEVGLNFFFMELSMLPTTIFNETLQEVFAGTKRGVEIINGILGKIEQSKEQEEFNDYIEKNNNLYPMDDGYFTEDDFSGERPFGY